MLINDETMVLRILLFTNLFFQSSSKSFFIGIKNFQMRIFIVAFGTVLSTSLGREKASNFLKRKPRVLDDLYLESQPDNFERECAEKRCDTEEFDELYDFETGLVKVTVLSDIWSPTKSIQLGFLRQFFRTVILNFLFM